MNFFKITIFINLLLFNIKNFKINSLNINNVSYVLIFYE